MSRKKWIISQFDKKLAADIAYEYGFDEFAVLLLISRGITDPFQIAEFLQSDAEFSDPFEITDMDKAVCIITNAIESGDRITVFGDYDADGVTATALLYSYLQTVGADVDYYIPSRITEGYGMHKEAIDKLHQKGTKLIITVDNGISAIEETDYINSLGIDVVITDHHQPGEILPNAKAVVDPHRQDDTSDCKMLAGVGVAFKLISALEEGNYDNVIEDFADLVAIGTIADIVPLRGENRTIVKKGLEIINSNPRCGVDALKQVCGFKDKEYSSTSLAFSVAPRINAAGRVETAEKALKLLLSEDSEEALALAGELDECNTKRQGIESEIFDLASKKVQESPLLMHSKVLVVSGEGWHSGVIGIVASRLVDRFGKPAIVLSRDGTDIAKGSCRSIEGFSLFDALTYTKDWLVQFGGHTLAAGFSIRTDKIDGFTNAINEYALTLGQFTPTLKLDCKLNPASVNLSLLDSLSMLEPFGAQNPQPLFCLCNMTVKSVKAVGTLGKHIRLLLERNGIQLWAVYFGMSAERFPYKIGESIDIAITVDKNEFKGEIKPNISIRAVRPAGSDDSDLFASMALYEKAVYTCDCNKREIDFIRPDRHLAESVFRLTRTTQLPIGQEEILCNRLSLQSKDVCKIKILLNAFCETGLIEEKDGYYSLCQYSQKVDLKNASILKKLGYKG